MDMKETIKREPKEVKEEAKKPEPKVLYELHCTLVENPSDRKDKDYSFNGKVKGEDMDIDLMSSVFASIIKNSVPADVILEVMNETADKLGLEPEDKKCSKEIKASKSSLENTFIKLLKLLGE